MKTPDEETDGVVVLPTLVGPPKDFEPTLPPGLPPENMPQAAVALLELLSSANGVVLNLGSEIVAIERERSLLAIRANKLDQVKSEVQRILVQQLPGQFSVEYYQQLQQNIANKVAFARNGVLKQARPLGPIQPLPPPTVGDWYKFAVDSEELGQKIVASNLSEVQYREHDSMVPKTTFGEVLSALQEQPGPYDAEKMWVDLADLAKVQPETTTDNAALKESPKEFSGFRPIDASTVIKAVEMSVPDPDEVDGFTDVLIDENPPSPPWVPRRESFIDRVFNWVMDKFS